MSDIHRAYTEQDMDRLSKGDDIALAILCAPERATPEKPIKHLVTLDNDKVTCSDCRALIKEKLE